MHWSSRRTLVNNRRWKEDHGQQIFQSGSVSPQTMLLSSFRWGRKCSLGARPQNQFGGLKNGRGIVKWCRIWWDSFRLGVYSKVKCWWRHLVQRLSFIFDVELWRCYCRGNYHFWLWETCSVTLLHVKWSGELVKRQFVQLTTIEQTKASEISLLSNNLFYWWRNDRYADSVNYIGEDDTLRPKRW